MSAGGTHGAADRPLLGVSGRWGDAEVELARRLDDLHQLIYRRGGIRPSSAAVEEVAKLVLIRLWALRHPAVPLPSGARAGDLFTRPDPGDFAFAFATALGSPELQARHPSIGDEPIWPATEPFRLTEPQVLDAAARLVAETVNHDEPTVSDPLGTAFDALLAGRYDHAGGLGTYLTPSGVARAMAEIAAELVEVPADLTGPGFGDPYCGTGRFLVALLEVLRERADPAAQRLLAAGPFGADQSAAAVAKARTNMLLYGVRRPLIWTVRDSVTDSDVDTLVGRVPLILTNPPFGERKYDDPTGVAATAAAVPSLAGRDRIDPSVACLVRSLRLLAPGGLLGIVLPDGVINSAAVADLILGGRTIVDHSRPDGGHGPGDRAALDVEPVACVSLPTATFALSGTVAKTSALFVRRRPPQRRPPQRRPPSHRRADSGRSGVVALARLEHVGYLRQGGRAAPDPAGNELPELPGLVVNGLRANAAGEASVTVVNDAPLVAVVAHDALRHLDPARFDPAAVAARQRVVESGGVELREYLQAITPRRPREVRSPFVSVLHVDELGTVDWTAARHHVPVTPGLLAEPGDVIVSLLNPSRLRAAVIPAGEPVQVSAEFGVFRAHADPYAVVGLLYRPEVRAQLRPLGTGTSSSRRRIQAEDVLGLMVPKLPAAALDELGREIRAAQRSIDTARERLRQLLDAPQTH
ncbi:MAG TPA: N-6 DNA methylase [Micromonosporaceae bacterium]|nr:N-6 DNA methylase [Micromonosporaceae bacterium]